MKFAILIYNDPALLGAMPDAKVDGEMRRCFEHADALREQGVLHDSQMLEDAASARSVRVRNGRRTVVDGPFAETNELLAGFNLIEADSMEEAVQIAAAFPWVNTGCVEVREVKNIDTERARVAGAEQLPHDHRRNRPTLRSIEADLVDETMETPVRTQRF